MARRGFIGEVLGGTLVCCCTATSPVAIIDAGIALDGHGDQADIEVSKLRLLPVRLNGPKPSHIWTAQNVLVRPRQLIT